MRNDAMTWKIRVLRGRPLTNLLTIFTTRWRALSLVVFGLLLPAISFAATDPFAGTKDEINAALGSSSQLHFALLAAGMAISGVTGVLTRNWAAAVGTFVALMIFMNVAGGFIGMS
jgi:type IV conjugative transfer system pilin TraA